MFGPKSIHPLLVVGDHAGFQIPIWNLQGKCIQEYRQVVFPMLFLCPRGLRCDVPGQFAHERAQPRQVEKLRVRARIYRAPRGRED